MGKLRAKYGRKWRTSDGILVFGGDVALVLVNYAHNMGSMTHQYIIAWRLRCGASVGISRKIRGDDAPAVVY